MRTGKTYVNVYNGRIYRVVREDACETCLFALNDKTHKEGLDFDLLPTKTFKGWIKNRIYVDCEDPTDYVNTYIMSEQAREKMNERFKIAKEICAYEDGAFFKKSKRKRVLDHFSGIYGLSHRTLRRLMNSYFNGNMCPIAVAPRTTNNGCPGKTKKYVGKPGPAGKYPGTTAYNSQKKFEAAYKKIYLGRQKKSIRDAYDYLVNTYFTGPNGNELPTSPTYDQFRRYVHKQDSFTEAQKREGKRAAEQKYRVHHSTEDADATFPYQIVQIDATPLSVNCVSTYNQNVLVGRPHAYFAIDVYSRMVVGFALTFENNGYLSLVECIVNIVEDKEKACHRDGFEIEPGSWNVSGIFPTEIDVDRGEGWSRNAKNITEVYGCKIENKKSYRGDLKGIVERLIGSVESYVKTHFPGAILKDHPDRGDRDNSGEACLNINDVKEILVHKIIEHNNLQIDKFSYSEEQLLDQELPVPRLLFENGLPKAQGVRQDVDPEKLRWNIIKEEERTIRTDKMVYLNDLRYSAQDENIQALLRKLAGKKVRVMYSERDTNHIRVIEEQTRSDFMLELIPKQRTDLTRSERMALKEATDKKREEYNRTEGRRIKAATAAKTETVISEAQSRTDEKPDTKHKRENRQKEKEKLRQSMADQIEENFEKNQSRLAGPNARGWRK